MFLTKIKPVWFRYWLRSFVISCTFVLIIAILRGSVLAFDYLVDVLSPAILDLWESFSDMTQKHITTGVAAFSVITALSWIMYMDDLRNGGIR